MKLAGTHKIPVESISERGWDKINKKYKIYRYSKFIKNNIRKRVEKNLVKMVKIKFMENLEGFFKGVIPIVWEIDKGGEFTKLGFHCGSHKGKK